MRTHIQTPSNDFWYGRVEARNDPLQLGRVRVRIFGMHTEDTKLIPTENLPWALPVMPSISASLSGVGQAPVGLMEGTTVVGYFADGVDSQMPMVMGALNQLENFQGAGGGIHGDGNTINDSALGVPGNDNPTGDGPPWLKLARGEIGQKEIKGGGNNPRVVEYLRASGHGGGDETPWCAGFVSWCLKKTGFGKVRSASSKAFLAEEKLSKPLYGCMVIFHRPPNPNSGHIGFYVGAAGGRLKILGGNQGDAVNIQGKSAARLAGYRWPSGAPHSLANAGADDGGTTNNEVMGGGSSEV